MRFTNRFLAGLFAAGLANLPGVVAAGDITVSVTESGQPLEHAVVYILPAGELTDGPADNTMPPVSDPAGVMDQRNAQFMPHVLAVHKGAAVRFPNSDNIRHHVYSFSQAKRFQLRLYSGTSADPVVFDTTGPVVLGCNIHDWMLGYIYVVDTPWFAKTGQDGSVKLSNLPAGDYKLLVWHPRLPDMNKPVAQTITINKKDMLNKQISLTLKPQNMRDRNTPEQRSQNSLRDRRRGNL